MALQIAQDPAADRVLTDSPFALLMGMMLDQQFPMERAFAGPAKVLERFGSLDPAAIVAADPEEFAALCAVPPAVHRFPGSMAARIQGLAAVVVDEYGGHADRLWTEATSGRELMRRLQALPGFGKQKAQIFTALLAQAARRASRGLGGGGRRLRRAGLPPLRRGRGRPGVAGPGAGVQEAEEGGGPRGHHLLRNEGGAPPEGGIPATPHLFVNPESPRGHQRRPG